MPVVIRKGDKVKLCFLSTTASSGIHRDDVTVKHVSPCMKEDVYIVGDDFGLWVSSKATAASDPMWLEAGGTQ